MAIAIMQYAATGDSILNHPEPFSVSSPGLLVTSQTDPHLQSREVQHLHDCMVGWQVPLVPVCVPVELSGQHKLLWNGQDKPLKSLQFTRDLSVVHCQGPARQ
jgi:hypothetical protein